jgi:hypothetical protein
MNGGLQQFARLLERIDRITAKAVEPVSVEFWLNASNREWDAEMARRYGANWKSLDDADDMTQQEWNEWKAEQEANYDC